MCSVGHISDPMVSLTLVIAWFLYFVLLLSNEGNGQRQREWCVCRIEVSQSRREIDARRTAKRARERLPHPISRPRPRLVQASASLPTLLRSFVGTGGRCLRAVRERECLNNSSEFINDLYAPAFPSLE
jgi:hypothetical protein